MAGAFDHLYRDSDARAGVNFVTDEAGTPASLGEVRSASFGIMDREGKSNSALNAYSPFVDERADLYEELTGENGTFLRMNNGLQEGNRARIRGYIDNGELTLDALGKVQANSPRAKARGKTDAQLIRSMFEVDRMSALHPGKFLTDTEIDAKVVEDLRVKREADLKVLARSKGKAGTFQQFIGAAGGALTDPLILTTLPLGMGTITGPSVVANFGKAFLSEGAIAAAIEIPIQAEVFNFKDRIGSPYSFKEAAFNVLAASVGAGLLRGTGSVTIDVAKGAVAKFKARSANRPITPEEQRAVDELETYVRDAGQNPLGEVNETAHLDALDKAADDLEAGRAPDVEEIVGDIPPAGPDPDVPGGRMYRPEDFETFDPRELEVDADLFQFKTGGDEEGVTRAFKDIDEFRMEQAGQVIVYETTDGRRFIVDGHQRMGIARRSIAAGQDPDTVKLFGVVLRESDGVTTGEARALAAYKNIAEGTGTGLDAAKVMRELGDEGMAGMPPLPRAGVVASRGQSLSRLGDDSFMAVVNEIVPEDQAAIVGELIADNVLQKAAIDTLARVEPANQVQAREVIKQVREAGATVQESGDMFGDMIVETLVLERAKVVDDALRTLRAETNTFKTLVKKQESIEGAGDNVLDKATNEQQVLENGKAIEILQREAHTKGPVSEAVQRAAERLKAGESRRSVSQDFLGDLQAATTRDPAPGAQPGGARSAEAAELVEDNAPRPAAKGEDSNPVEGTQGEKADQLGKLSDANEKIIDKILIAVDKKFGSKSNSSRKTKESIVGKANRPSILAKKPWFNVEHLRDSFRFRSVVEDINDVDKIFKFIKARAAMKGVEIIKTDIEKQLSPGEWGWRMVAFDMKMPNGQMVEFYLPVRELSEAQGGLRPGQVHNNHELFEKWRKEDFTKLSPERQVEALADIEESAKWYQEGWDAYLARTGQTEEEISASLKSLEASLSPAGTKKPAKSSPVRDMPGDELQPDSVLNRKPLSERTTAETGNEPGSRNTETLGPDISNTSRASIEDLGGHVDRQAQALADAERAKDAGRQGTRDVDVGEGEFFGQGGKLEADLFDETGPLSKAQREADLYDEAEAAEAIEEARQILNDQDVDLPTDLVDRGGDPQIISRGGRELMDDLDDADQAIIDMAVCKRSAA